MKEESSKIEDKIKSLRDIADVKYSVPKNRTQEYTKRLFKNQEALTYLVRERKLNLTTIENFQLGLSEKNEIVIPIYKENKLIDYKFRSIPPVPKSFRRVQNTETWIFNGDEGFKEAQHKEEIIITEGEMDAVSVWQAGFKNVISLVGGANHISKWIEKLDDIKIIYINLDSDEVGQKAAKELAERIGIEHCINVKLPEKDANDFFRKYTSKDYENVLLNSNKFPIEDVVMLDELFEDVKSNPSNKKDFEFPFPRLQYLTGGFNKSNAIIISAPTSMGKSTFTWNTLVKISEKKIPVMYIPLEDNITFVARRLFNIIGGFSTSRFTEDDWDTVKEKVIDLPFYMYTGQEKFDLEVFEKIIEKGKKLYGIDIFALDHLHFLARRGGDMVQEIGFLIRHLVSLSRIHNVTIFVLVQLRKQQGSDKGWTQMPHMESLSDSAKLQQDAHMVLMLFQQYEKDAIGEVMGQPFIELAVQKNREGNRTLGNKYINYDFDTETGIITEQEEIILGTYEDD